MPPFAPSLFLALQPAPDSDQSNDSPPAEPSDNSASEEAPSSAGSAGTSGRTATPDARGPARPPSMRPGNSRNGPPSGPSRGDAGSRRTRGPRRRPDDRPGRTPGGTINLSSTGEGSLTNSTANGHDFPSFKIISDRNIFNANRSARSRRTDRESDRPKPADILTLVGTLTSEKGAYAFFDGSKPEFRKVLEPGKTLASCRLTEITLDSVKLDAGTNHFELVVGMQLRREEDAWRVVESSRPAALAPTSSSESAATASANEESEVLKQLMQQREQDLK